MGLGAANAAWSGKIGRGLRVLDSECSTVAIRGHKKEA